MHFRRATASDLDAITALQQASYARNRALLGVEPIPLQADYRRILASMDVWLAEANAKLIGALIVESHADHLLIWSIAADPATHHGGLGRTMLQHAETLARARGLRTLKLYTGTKFVHLVDWYGRHGYVVDNIEQRPDRSITHMSKVLHA